jgi:hypothetical protein
MAEANLVERVEDVLLENGVRRGGHGALALLGGTAAVALAVGAVEISSLGGMLTGFLVAIACFREVVRNHRRLRDLDSPARLLLDDPEKITGVRIVRRGVWIAVADRRVRLVVEPEHVALIVAILQQRCPYAIFEQPGRPPELPPARARRLGRLGE